MKFSAVFKDIPGVGVGAITDRRGLATPDDALEVTRELDIDDVEFKDRVGIGRELVAIKDPDGVGVDAKEDNIGVLRKLVVDNITVDTAGILNSPGDVPRTGEELDVVDTTEDIEIAEAIA